MEANEDKRAVFEKLIKDVKREDLVYIDESGIEHNSIKERGWGKRGISLKRKKSGKYYLRTNIIAGYAAGKPIAPFVFHGSCHRELFENWVEHLLVKELRPGQTVIMDNAAFHKSEKVKQLLEESKCKIIFLPPYSPDLNPIEKFWANMKRWIKQHLYNFDNLFLALSSFFNKPNST